MVKSSLKRIIQLTSLMISSSVQKIRKKRTKPIQVETKYKFTLLMEDYVNLGRADKNTIEINSQNGTGYFDWRWQNSEQWQVNTTFSQFSKLYYKNFLKPYFKAFDSKNEICQFGQAVNFDNFHRRKDVEIQMSLKNCSKMIFFENPESESVSIGGYMVKDGVFKIKYSGYYTDLDLEFEGFGEDLIPFIEGFSQKRSIHEDSFIAIFPNFLKKDQKNICVKILRFRKKRLLKDKILKFEIQEEEAMKSVKCYFLEFDKIYCFVVKKNNIISVYQVNILFDRKLKVEKLYDLEESVDEVGIRKRKTGISWDHFWTINYSEKKIKICYFEILKSQDLEKKSIFSDFCSEYKFENLKIENNEYLYSLEILDKYDDKYSLIELTFKKKSDFFSERISKLNSMKNKQLPKNSKNNSNCYTYYDRTDSFQICLSKNNNMIRKSKFAEPFLFFDYLTISKAKIGLNSLIINIKDKDSSINLEFGVNKHEYFEETEFKINQETIEIKPIPSQQYPEAFLICKGDYVPLIKNKNKEKIQVSVTPLKLLTDNFFDKNQLFHEVNHTNGNKFLDIQMDSTSLKSFQILYSANGTRVNSVILHLDYLELEVKKCFVKDLKANKFSLIFCQDFFEDDVGYLVRVNLRLGNHFGGYKVKKFRDELNRFIFKNKFLFNYYLDKETDLFYSGDQVRDEFARMDLRFKNFSGIYFFIDFEEGCFFKVKFLKNKEKSGIMKDVLFFENSKKLEVEFKVDIPESAVMKVKKKIKLKNLNQNFKLDFDEIFEMKGKAKDFKNFKFPKLPKTKNYKIDFFSKQFLYKDLYNVTYIKNFKGRNNYQNTFLLAKPSKYYRNKNFNDMFEFNSKNEYGIQYNISCRISALSTSPDNIIYGICFDEEMNQKVFCRNQYSMEIKFLKKYDIEPKFPTLKKISSNFLKAKTIYLPDYMIGLGYNQTLYRITTRCLIRKEPTMNPFIILETNITEYTYFQIYSGEIDYIFEYFILIKNRKKIIQCDECILAYDRGVDLNELNEVLTPDYELEYLFMKQGKQKTIEILIFNKFIFLVLMRSKYSFKKIMIEGKNANLKIHKPENIVKYLFPYIPKSAYCDTTSKFLICSIPEVKTGENLKVKTNIIIWKKGETGTINADIIMDIGSIEPKGAFIIDDYDFNIFTYVSEFHSPVRINLGSVEIEMFEDEKKLSLDDFELEFRPNNYSEEFFKFGGDEIIELEKVKEGSKGRSLVIVLSILGGVLILVLACCYFLMVYVKRVLYGRKNIGRVTVIFNKIILKL